MRILITRTDRIGDVVLSTPVFRALREAYPESYIAVIVRPYAKEVVEGNPYIDEVITYDKYGAHKSIFGSLKFVFNLRRKKFSLALILHPTNRMHIISLLSGIRRRVGFNRKLGFLLTDKVRHSKQLGEKHELDYTLDILKKIGIDTLNKSLYFPIKKDLKKWLSSSLHNKGIYPGDLLIAIHPTASCPSKRWPSVYFARLADELINKMGAKIIIVSGAEGRKFTDDTMSRMHGKAVDFTGKTSVGQLGSLIKESRLLVSNDSGPVHIAASLGIPVISIFGRRDKGLSPTRWRPVGAKTKVFHKDVGCRQCLAHNCKKEFECLRAITVEEVLEAAEKLIMGGYHDKIALLRTGS